MLDNTASSAPPSSSSDAFLSLENGLTNKRKRRPAGTPDPEAEVVSLSPRRCWNRTEPSCLHHDPCHALGDLVGIKKHFRRKHSNHKQWVCEKCSKGYAVQSDYKAHLKTCGTRGHSCDCGRVFSRVESSSSTKTLARFGRVSLKYMHCSQPARLERHRAPSPSSDTNNFSIAPLPGILLPIPKPVFLSSDQNMNNNIPSTSDHQQQHNLELQLLPSSDEIFATHLKLSIGSSDASENNVSEVARMKEFANEELKMAMSEKAYAEEARREAKRQIEIAEVEFANAKRIRQQAQAERRRRMKTSLAVSYMSSATTEGE
ncbi:hypothetical protein SLA2020_270780 [Shorea laevis]